MFLRNFKAQGPMTRNDNDQGRRGAPSVVLVVTAILLPLIYVALSGPTHWLANHDYFGETLRFIYAPLMALEDAAVGDILRRYWSSWT
jgi:hypothetical protein